MRKIILMIDCSSEYDRRLLRGLVQYSKEHGPWLFYRMPSDLIGNHNGGEYVIDWVRRWNADAIIGRWRWEDTSILSSLNIPIVLQNYSQRSSKFSNLTGDYVGTGELAARYFIEKGYNNFAYFGVNDVIWSVERLEGLRRETAPKNINIHSLLIDNFNKEREKVVNWLHSIPKPCAMLACDDAYALFLTETGKVENIHIPDEIALLGVDNDELLCQISDPQISSIELKVEQGSYRLAQILERQFESKEVWPFSVSIEPGTIIERSSTKVRNITDPYVDIVTKYIEKNFDQYITMNDISRQVPMSRRNLEIRFKKEFGSTTIYNYLSLLRIQKVASLLSTTDMNLGQIADKCGIINESNISRVFKKFYGCSPAEYRKKNRGKQH